jgi:hypothetical protein
MPRYRVTETRSYKVAYLIDAEDEGAALRLDGEIVSEVETDSYSESIDDAEQVADDEEEVEV